MGFFVPTSNERNHIMAVLLQITYQKKLGLPNFSSHSCSVSVQVEVADLNQVAEENNRLYKLLQASLDEEIQKVGFMPDATSYGMNGNGGQATGHPALSHWLTACRTKGRVIAGGGLPSDAANRHSVGATGRRHPPGN